MLLEVLSYMPDILIMQEIDRFDWLNHRLKEFGEYHIRNQNCIRYFGQLC